MKYYTSLTLSSNVLKIHKTLQTKQLPLDWIVYLSLLGFVEDGRLYTIDCNHHIVTEDNNELIDVLKSTIIENNKINNSEVTLLAYFEKKTLKNMAMSSKCLLSHLQVVRQVEKNVP